MVEVVIEGDVVAVVENVLSVVEGAVVAVHIDRAIFAGAVYTVCAIVLTFEL